MPVLDESFTVIKPLLGIPTEPSNIPPYSVAAIVAYCKQHKAIALNYDGGNIWLPFVIEKKGDQRADTLTSLINAITNVGNNNDDIDNGGLEVTDVTHIHTFKKELAGSNKFITRLIYFAVFEEKGAVTCKNSLRRPCNIQWVYYEQIKFGVTEYWGPEVKALTTQVTQRVSRQPSYPVTKEVLVCDALKLLSRKQRLRRKRRMIRNAGFDVQNVLKLYVYFTQHCWPSSAMCFRSFSDFLQKAGFGDFDNEALFRSFKLSSSKNYIGFQELLLGLAACSPNLEHTMTLRNLRVGYIFRFYNSRNSTFLVFSDIEQMLRHLYQEKMVVFDDIFIAQRAELMLNAIGLDKQSKIFKNAFSKLLLDYTSPEYTSFKLLFRAPVNVCEWLGRKIAQRISPPS